MFQKAFVEFFVPAKVVEQLEDRLMGRTDDMISMYAANKHVSRRTVCFKLCHCLFMLMCQGEFRTNTQQDAVNAVTWGVFPGQEIVQSTIIEQESFLAWKVGRPVLGRLLRWS